MTRRHARFLILALVLASWAVPHAQAGDWPGTEETIDGVLHVKNPATPMHGATTLDLEEEWVLGGWDDDENIFGVITAIIQDDQGNLYMLDSQLTEIRVYDPDGNFLRTIGREGEGPGEFQNAFSMFNLPGGNIGVLQSFPTKIVMLTPEGEPAGEFPLPDTEGEGFRVLFSARYAGDNLALLYGMNQPSQEKFSQLNRLALVSADGTSESLLHEQSSTMNFASPEIAESEWDTFRNRWAAFPDGRALSVLDYSEYKIHIWGQDGKLDRVVHVDYPADKRTDEEYETMLELYKGFTKQIPIPNIEYELDENHPPINGGGLYTREDGSLWVLNSEGTWGVQDGTIGVFDVFDAKGRYLHQVTLKGDGEPREDGYFFVGDRLFVVTDWVNALMVLQTGGGTEEEAEEEVEPMRVICYSLDSPKVGLK